MTTAARNLARFALVILGALGSVILTASPANACTLLYADGGGLTPCGATAAALGLAALGTGAGVALVASAAVSLARAANMEMAADNPRILTQAVAQLLSELDAQALAGAQRQLQATAAGMGLPVTAFAPGPLAEVPFTPTTGSLVAAMRAVEGIGADYVRQLSLAQVSTTYQTAAQLGQNLAVPQTRGSGTQIFRSDTRTELEDTLTAGYMREGAPYAQAQARAASEAKAVMSQFAALHLPDLVAGGFDTATTLGLRSVNSSIGSQLRPDRLGAQLRAYVDSIPPQLRPTTLVNLIFRLHLP